MDILQPLTKQQLNEMLILIKKQLPRSIRGHHYLYNYLKNCDKFNLDLPENRKISDRCKPKFYGKYNGNIENCTFIAITEGDDSWIFLYTLQNGNELSECLRNTSRINWKSKWIYVSIENEYFSEINKVLNEKRTDWLYCTPERFYYLPKEIAISFVSDQLPKNFSLKKLNLTDATIINEHWPHKYQGSLKYIENVLHMNGGTGLLKDNILIAWIATNDFFSPGFFNTLANERRKGYASIVCKAECARIANNYNTDILIYIVQGNIASENLFHKLGFKCVNELRWIQIKHSIC